MRLDALLLFSYPASNRFRVERESFGGLVQIYLLVRFHNFQLVLPSVAHQVVGSSVCVLLPISC